ncbi:hypothetical protein [Flavobacterium palustre]|nr:hypothetical protein [Flavobacterium palustre]
MKIFQTIKSIFHKTDKTSRNVWTDKELMDFTKNLIQVICWTEELSKKFDFQNGKYGLVFRKTNPELNGSKLYSFDDDYATWTIDDYSFDNYDLLLDLALKQRPNSDQVDLSKLDELGRILSFQTCVTTHDGAPIVESRNFVDEGDVPPIDTWFYLKRNYFHSDYKCEQSLFCWIPKKFEKVIQQAIDVEILDSYRWFDENDKYNYDRIKNSR